MSSSNCSFLGSAFLADFVMLWLCKPLAEGEHRPEPFKALLMNLFYSLAKVIASSKVSLPVGPVPPEIAGHLARDENARVMDSAVSALIADSVEGKGAGAAGFHTALASVVDGSGQLAEVLLQLLLQPELFLRPADELSSCDSENLCEWLQDLQRSCEDWERVVRSVRALSQCGPFALDLRYFTFIGEQVGPALLGLATYAVNLAGVNSGRRLWKDMSDLVARFSKPVASLEDMVGELELLSNVYQNLNNFQNDCSQLTPLVAALASVTKSFLLTSRLPDLRSTGRTASVESMPERFLLDFQEDEDERKAEGALAGSAERREKGRAHGVGHPYGGLSTGALQFLCLKTEDVRQKLQGLVEKVLATLPARSEPFQKLVAEESRAVDEAALTAWKELEEKLSPSSALAIDARCSLTRVGAADTETRTGPGEAKAATLQLTTGGFSSFFDVQSALADFERSYRELDGRNQLMNRFQDLAGCTSRPGEGRMEKLRAKLVALRVFWRAAQEWDKEVEKRLRQSPALVNITDLQRQAHFTLRAVSQCPKEHQELLRQRINAFRQVFRQLFMVQSIMCLNAKNETRKLVPYSPPQAHVWSNLFDTPVNLKPRDFSGNCFGFEKELLPGEASTGDKPGFDPNDTMTSLGRLLRAGVLDDHAKVARQYAMATRESQEMRSLLCHVISWSQQSLPVTPAGAKGQPVLAAAALAEQLESLERQLESALRRAKPYPQLFQEEKPLAGDDFYLGTFYKDLSETWLRRLRAMRQNLLKFMECQDLWLHLSPSKNDLRAELRKADVIFRSLADDMAANPQARTCLEDVLSSEGGVQEACALFTQAYARASRDLQDLRAECFRLFFLEDEALLELCGSTNISRSNCLPQLFPGWSEVTFAPDAATPGSSALSITGVRPTSGPPLQLLEPVALNVPLQEWLKRLEQQVATTFQQLLRQEASGKHERDELQTNLPEHVAVTAQRIRWTYLVEAMSSRPEAMDIFTAYAEKRVKEEVARNTGAASSKETFAGAGLTWALELRALLQRSKEASDLVFLRMAWRGEALAVQLGPLCLEFGWELYGGEELICPVTEKCYVDLAQQLCDVSLPQLQGMGCSVTRAFAASCGIACHQCYVLSEPESLRGFRRLALGAGLLGHWVV
ncbi:unnamed protein product [Effrenium voratum]|nr:unnamed protein product [Effrenium voratum]